MPEISRFYGIMIYMFYNDHNPPHFHINYQGYDAIIEIKNDALNGYLPKKALRLVYKWLDLHRKELLQNWSRMEQRKPLFKIKALD